MNMNAPAIFLGIQPGFNHLPAIELYNLLAKVGHHPPGSTVSRKTLEEHGYVPPAFPTSQPNHVEAPKYRR
jgi:hypothetical protein